MTNLVGKMKIAEVGLMGKTYLDGVRVTSSPSKSYDENLVTLMTMKEQLKRAIDEYLNLQFLALDIFDQLSDTKERACLSDYYLCGLAVDEIAELNACCTRTVKRKLKTGLEKIEKLSPREDEEQHHESREKAKKFDNADSFLEAMARFEY